MNLFGVGSSEMVLIVVLAVVLFGERLPEVARLVARLTRQLRTMSREFQDALRLDD
ncbi:MAG: twin-arginine translocase TatA/TatE family subunit [Armatimonadetes bacterium]|nr:twin-arginine translocase TatA/TatE family subunit [Armatimonadota bacterium]